MKLCTAQPCDRPQNAKGLCHKHYMLLRKYGRTNRITKPMGGKCLVDECLIPVLSNDLCSKHYQRARRTGNLDDPIRESEKDRFMRHVEVMTSGCWAWNGNTMRHSKRGIFILKRKNTLAYRAAWILFVGEIPDGLLACHKCDNPNCVNPDHLFIGTHKDNMQDAKRKGRINTTIRQRGGAHTSAKLKEYQVIEIRKRLAAGEKQPLLAAEYKVSTSLISAINTRQIWKQL